MELKDWVLAARAHKGLTQQRLGDQVGRTKANVAHWESGKVKPSYAQVLQIASITGYPMPDQLAGTMPQDPASAPLPPGGAKRLNDTKRQILADLEELMPEDVARFAADINARAEEMRKYRLHFMTKAQGASPAGLAEAPPTRPAKRPTLTPARQVKTLQEQQD